MSFALYRRKFLTAGTALAATPVAARAQGREDTLEIIGQRPLLELDMRLGEASAAALAVPILKAAAACHNGMATFAEAGVSGKA